MTTAAMNGGPVGGGPKLGLGHCVAIAMELVMLGTFTYEGSVFGVLVSLVYGYYFSATGAGIYILAKKEG